MEISVAMVVVSSIAGTVFAGKSLLDNVKMRSFIQHINEIEVATNNFVETYNAVPGNFSDSQVIWGASKCPSADPYCIGNGSGLVQNSPNNLGHEPYTFFMHLSLAGLTDRLYDGYNLPTHKWRGTSAAVVGLCSPGLGKIFQRCGNMLEIGTIDAGTNSMPNRNTFTGEEMYSIDLKMDDGIPSSGKIVGFHWGDYNGHGYSSTSGCFPVDAFPGDGCDYDGGVYDPDWDAWMITCYEPQRDYGLSDKERSCVLGYFIPSINKRSFK